MSAFLFWWTLGSSLCSAVAAIIATGALSTQSFKFFPIAIVVYWILLGIVEWRLLSPHISRAYQWGLVTIVGGIIGSCLVSFAFLLILWFLFKDFSPVAFGNSHPSVIDFLIALFASIICLFIVGFLLGFSQSSVLSNSFSQTNKVIPIVTGLAWIIGPIVYIAYTTSILFVKDSLFSYIFFVTLLGVVSSFPKGFILGKLFESNGSLQLDALLWKELIKLGVFLLVLAMAFHPFRYPILHYLGFTHILYDAVLAGRIDAKDFLSHGGNPNIDDRGSNILHKAVSRENLTLISLLLSYGADVNARDFRGDTPLHYSRAKNKEVVKLLIDKGANVNAQNKYGTSIIHFANNKEIIELLIKNGADINDRDSKGKTPLHRKILNLDKEVAQLLLAYGANPNIKDRHEQMPLHQVESVEFAKILIANGADINAQGWLGSTPLHSSVAHERLEITKFLLKRGAEINARDRVERTPLHLALTLEMAQLLVDRGAKINAKDKEGWTPLHTIVQRSRSPYVEMAKLLLDSGAKVNDKDRKGRTPLDLAYENNRNESNKDMIELLKRYGGVVSK